MREPAGGVSRAGAPAPLAIEAPALAAAGALQTLAFVHTAWWPLPIATAAMLAWRLQRAGARRAFVLAWCFGTGWLLGGVWWLFVSMHRYGGLPAWLAAAAVLALAAALSLYLGAAGAAYARWRSGRPAGDALLFAALWLLAELARGIVLTGFPWVAAGYSQVDAPLAALAPWLGVYGIGAAMAWTGAAAAHALAHPLRQRDASALRRRWAPAAAALLLLGALALVGPGSFTQGTGTLRVTLLQPNVPQDQKFAAERLPQTLAGVHQAMVEAGAGLVVAPETAVPLLPDQLEALAPGYWAALEAHFAQPGRAALVGVPLGDFERGYTNSVAGLTTQGALRYDKAHLVPFGEFIPRGFRWFTELMNIPLGDFARGPLDPAPFAMLGQRVAPNICYEDLFGEELARRFADPARAPTVFANLSNIGWFGRTVAVDQHLHISRLRALEFQRPMVRATNTGATAAIAHDGRVVAALPPHTSGVLAASVEGRSGLTPYAAWVSRLGLAPLAAAALAVVAFAAARHRRPG